PAQRLDRQTARHVLDILRALKFSNQESELTAQLVGVSHASCEQEWTAVNVRKLLAELDRDKRGPALELWESEVPPCAALLEHARRSLAVGDPLGVGDLVISGKDLMSELKMTPGPAIRRILAMLLDFVIEDPARNTRDVLLEEAQRLELSFGRQLR